MPLNLAQVSAAWEFCRCTHYITINEYRVSDNDPFNSIPPGYLYIYTTSSPSAHQPFTPNIPPKETKNIHLPPN